MESQKKGWTNEDKAWAIGGGIVAVSGGIYWYMQNQKNKETDPVVGTDTAYLDATDTTEVAIDKGSSTSSSPQMDSKPVNTKPVTTTRQPDTLKWRVGQEMMANSSSGTKVYETRIMANGQYTTDKPAVLKDTFKQGDKIGKIIWVGKMSDGTYRYVIQGFIYGLNYWIADYRLITPSNGSKASPTGKPATTQTTTSSLNVNLMLKKGSKGAEVKELQKRLAVRVPDGIFGIITETNLKKQKGVTQITLATFATTNASTLNFNIMLKKGSKGLEVKELQKRLGFAGANVDGDFGAKTESALFAMKAVKQTTLNQFSSK